MTNKNKVFKKWFLRFKNPILEEAFQKERRKLSYNKFKKFNILVTSANIFIFILLCFAGLLADEYRDNDGDFCCQIHNDYRLLTCLPAMIGAIQIDTILMKFNILHWMRGTLTLLTYFICTTEMSVYKLTNYKV